jgi:predicted transcriptional regulator
VVATEVMLIAVCVLATEFLHKAKQAKDVAIEDLRDAISFLRVAAQRFTNLATMHLGVPVHFMKVNRAGIIYKALRQRRGRVAVGRQRLGRGAAECAASGRPDRCSDNPTGASGHA